MALRLESMPKSGILPGIERAAGAYQNVTSNLFGRSFGEAFSDLSSLIHSLQTPRTVTPSLVFDTDSSPPSSPSNWSPVHYPHDLSRDVSPPGSPTGHPMLKASQTIIEMQVEEGLVSATQAMDIQSDRLSLQEVPSSTEEPSAPISLDISVEEVVDIPSPPPPPPSAPVLPVVGPETSIQQILEAMAMLRAPVPPPEALPDILPPSPTRFEEEEEEDDDVNPALASSQETSLAPRHGKQKKQKSSGPFKCPQCPGKTFTRHYDMMRHMKTTHEVPSADNDLARTCPCCYEVLSRSDSFRRHILKVPASCLRLSKLKGKSKPPEHPESLYQQCRNRNPPPPTFIPVV